MKSRVGLLCSPNCSSFYVIASVLHQHHHAWGAPRGKEKCERVCYQAVSFKNCSQLNVFQVPLTFNKELNNTSQKRWQGLFEKWGETDSAEQTWAEQKRKREKQKQKYTLGLGDSEWATVKSHDSGLLAASLLRQPHLVGTRESSA